jgi:rhodanese-related sulfurtransferase
MHFDPIIMSFVIISLLITILLLLVIRSRHYAMAGRELDYLIRQDDFEYILIDIRKNRDYMKGHIPNALNVPYPDAQGFLPTENMFEKIYIYGENLRQARSVARQMGITGYFNVSYFGAFRKWKGPVEKENE